MIGYIVIVENVQGYLIIAINMLSRTMILITLYEPNINIAQKRVKLLMPCSSNAIKSTRPNDAQNSDWDVSNKLQSKIKWENFCSPRYGQLIT